MNNSNNKQGFSLEAIITIAAVSSVLVPLAIFTIISLHSSSEALTNVIKQELETQSILVSYSIDSFNDERIVDAKVISQADVFEQDELEPKIQYLTEIAEENKWIVEIDILALDGKIVASSGVQNETGDLFSEHEALFLSASEAGQGQVFVSEASILNNGPGVLFITPITDDSNTKPIGLLAIEVNLGHILNIVTALNQGGEGEKHAYVVDNRGKVIATNNGSVKFLEPFPDLSVQPILLDDFSEHGNIGSVKYTNATGVEVLAAFVDLNEFGENNALDWSFITIVPISEIAAPVTDLKYLLLTLSAFIALVAVMLAYRLSGAYSSNLEKIATQAKKISQGIYSKHLPITTKRSGAFQTLVGAFNKMETNLEELVNELKDREQRLDITLNSIGDGVIATDKNGNVTRMNPTSEKMTGWKFADAEGKSVKEIFSIVDETSREPIQNPVEKVIATGDTVYLNNHTTLLSKDGSEHQIEDSAAPIRDETSKIHGMILIFSDVTRRKQAEKQYRRTLKMDALGKLTGGIAHDYNNMLGVIVGYCDLLESEIGNQPQLLHYVSTIQKSAQRGANLTKKLLDFSRHKSAESIQLNLNTLLLNQEFMLQKTLTVRIELVLDLKSGVWPVYLNESDMIDVILNISINAMHAIEGNGRLTIRTNNTKINEIDAHVLGLVAGDYVLLSFTDTGRGMNENIHDRIFDPFFSTKGENGTGLGLSQVYGFVQSNKGAIQVYSQPGHGSQFALYFPRHHEIAQDEESLPTTDVLKTLNSQTILVVDDEADLMRFCCAVLERHGFATFSALNAESALEILNTKEVDIVLSDVIMPGMNGYQLAEIIKESYPKIKILLTSGFDNDLIGNEIDQSLKKNLLNKPYSSQDLLQAITRLINESLH